MAWPVPANMGSAPAIALPPLPWAGRDSRPSRGPIIDVVNGSQRSRRRKESVRKAKYASAMLAGLVAVGLAKRIINSIPLLNIFTRPVLDLVPTVIAGPALGAALVYGLEQGDLLAARHVVREKAAAVRQEVAAVVRDLSSDLAWQAERSQAVLESTARAAAQSVAELERTVVPALEREFRHIEAHTRRALQDGDRDGGAR